MNKTHKKQQKTYKLKFFNTEKKINYKIVICRKSNYKACKMKRN